MEYIKIPKNLDRDILVKEFGNEAVTFYEARIAQRRIEGKIYYNSLKTIYLWATQDRRTNQGYYTTYRGYAKGRRHKNYGGS